jgi:small-conductance mechanosensitive channel
MAFLFVACSLGGWGAPAPSPSPSASAEVAPLASPSAVASGSPAEVPAASPSPSPSPSVEPSPTPTPEPRAAVKIGTHVAFYVEHSIGSLTPQQRADIVNERLLQVVDDPQALPTGFEVEVDKESGLPYVQHRRFQRALITVYPVDAGALAPTAVASDWVDGLADALHAYRNDQLQQQQMVEEERLDRENARGAGRAIAFTLGFVVSIFLLTTLIDLFRRWSKSALRLPGLTIRGTHIITPDHMRGALVMFLTWLRVAVWVVLTALYVQIVLAAFPGTRKESDFLWTRIVDGFNGLGNAVLGALPGLVNIVVVVFVTRLALRAFNFVMRETEEGRLSLEPYIPTQFVRPSRSVGRFLIVVIALFFIAPNIPGSGTDVAKVVTVFLGVIVSFSSTSTIGNTLAGLVIAYMRPFARGDRVRIGDFTGDVTDYTMLYTRIRTPKNEDVLVPSLQVLGTPIVNYSAAPDGVIVHTTVSIGYDSPRTQVEALLLEAAGKVPGLEADPPPFVLVTSLDDFYVSYELNVYTRRPSELPWLYSGLHKSIKDGFDAAGVEIMSPHYYALRRGGESTIPRP